MKISIAADKVRFTLPVPLSLVSLLAPCIIKGIPSEKLPLETKSWIIETLPDILKSLKQYKGLIIVDVETIKGEKILIKM